MWKWAPVWVREIMTGAEGGRERNIELAGLERERRKRRRRRRAAVPHYRACHSMMAWTFTSECVICKIIHKDVCTCTWILFLLCPLSTLCAHIRPSMYSNHVQVSYCMCLPPLLLSLAYPGAYPLEKTVELVKAVWGREEARASSHFSVGSKVGKKEEGKERERWTLVHFTFIREYASMLNIHFLSMK